MASSNLNESPLAAGSSAASMMSTSTSASANSSSKFGEEDFLVLKFRDRKDFQSFQELVIGPDAILQAQGPLWKITSKYRKTNQGRPESKQQCVRLWRRGILQYLLFYANTSSEKKYKEYRMSLFGLEKTSDKCVKLCTDPSSSSSTPVQGMGLTRPIEPDCVTDLEFLLIEFDTSDQQKFFWERATVKAFDDAPVLPPLSFPPYSPAMTGDSISRSQTHDKDSSPFFQEFRFEDG